MSTLTSLHSNAQRLDGGAMFGNAPKALWTRWMTPDDDNRVPLACRCLLWQHKGRNILFETGIGAFFDPKMRARFGVSSGEHELLHHLASIGLTHEDIDVVVLSHLHFDHAGGLLTAWQEDNTPELLFPNATFVVGREAWERAKAPHFRDRASFIPALQPLLEASGRLELVDGPHTPALGEEVSFVVSHGHTPGLLVSVLQTSLGPIAYAADLIPGAPWVHLPITMGYDRFPELLIEEKQRLLEYLLANQGWLAFTHDPDTALARVAKDERGRFQATHLHGDLERHSA